jgi:hypothetical protein
VVPLAGVLAALVGVPVAAATCPVSAVQLEASGPSPALLRMPWGPLYFATADVTTASRVVFDDGSCIVAPVTEYASSFCEFSTTGRRTYRVDGFGAGTGAVDVVSPLAITAARSTVVFGKSLELLGGGTVGVRSTQLRSRSGGDHHPVRSQCR